MEDYVYSLILNSLTGQLTIIKNSKWSLLVYLFKENEEKTIRVIYNQNEEFLRTRK